MKPVLYRVETYIVPEAEKLSVINNIDDVHFRKQFNIKSENISQNSTPNEEDTFSLYNKCEEFASFSTENSKLIGVKIVKGITNETEIPFDENYDDDIIKYYNNINNSCPSKERLCMSKKTEFQSSVGPQESLYPATQFSRINSLTSIDEKSERSLDTKLSDFCRHGYKNGCTASIPSPEEISEEIFRENWLQKIEVLRNREAILREREMNLQKRERNLFRKEKELRINERILSDKIKQLDQQLKYQEDMVVGKRLEEAVRILTDIEKSDKLSEEKIPRKDIRKKEDISRKEEEVSRKEGVPKKVEIPRTEIPKKAEIPKNLQPLVNPCERKEEVPRKVEISKAVEIPKRAEMPKKAEIPKNFQPLVNPCERKEEVSRKVEIFRAAEISRTAEIPRATEIPKRAEMPKKAEIPKNLQSLVNPCEKKEDSDKKMIHPMPSHSSSRKCISRAHSYNSAKYKKERSKKRYDDLNSTLSAASLDSPNIRTSVWFNPTQYKKPHAFTRSASERRTKYKDTAGERQKSVVEETSDHIIEEKKIFRKVSNNICALQEKAAKFQNYGLVDCIPDLSNKAERNSNKEEKLSSYLNLEIGERQSHKSSANVSKDRPISWASETNECLQKKQQAPETAMKQSAENKENMCNTPSNTETTKPSTKPKKFFLFR